MAGYFRLRFDFGIVAVRRSSRKGPERQINTNEAEQQVNVYTYSSASPPLQTCKARLSPH